MQEVTVTVSTNVPAPTDENPNASRKVEEETTIKLPTGTGQDAINDAINGFGPDEVLECIVYGLRVRQMGKKRNELIAKHDPNRGERAKATVLKNRVSELTPEAKAELAALLGCDVEDLP